MSTITVSPSLLVHSGATKFYEIIGFANAAEKRFVEIRRWGKVGQMKNGGGQVSVIEHRSNADMAGSMEKQYRAKEKGHYQVDRSTKFGYNNGLGNQWTSNAFKTERHYADSKTRLDLFIRLALDAATVEPTVTPVTEPAFEPSVDRGEQWGSW